MTSTKPRDHPHQKGLPTPPPTKDPPDPIAADITARRNSSPPPSVTGSASKCPIRFLDQHSPEEVAEYFERHKHEIPRSHEVCVRRYQSNAQSIRELDSKYGDLVHMIQGLGLKHQPLLPENGDGEGAGQQVEDDHNGQERVQKWADDVGESDEDDGTADVESEDMRPALGSPLREVRVGESPSRPWGIPYPTADDDDDDDVEKASRRRASRSSRSSRIRGVEILQGCQAFKEPGSSPKAVTEFFFKSEGGGREDQSIRERESQQASRKRKKEEVEGLGFDPGRLDDAAYDIL
ncbi:MAG: hypothetical protein M1817_002236 [Caeruleum heppii]|nr:MAG: hypothetical protein M1817_002236 [Caeruleum heppii]